MAVKDTNLWAAIKEVEASMAIEGSPGPNRARCEQPWSTKREELLKPALILMSWSTNILILLMPSRELSNGSALSPRLAANKSA